MNDWVFVVVPPKIEKRARALGNILVCTCECLGYFFDTADVYVFFFIFTNFIFI